MKFGAVTSDSARKLHVQFKLLFFNIIIIIIIIIINLTANWLSPDGSGYYACT